MLPYEKQDIKLLTFVVIKSEPFNFMDLFLDSLEKKAFLRGDLANLVHNLNELTTEKY